MLGYFSLLRDGQDPVDVLVRGDKDAPVTELLAAVGIDPGSASAWELGGRTLGYQDRLRDLVIEGALLRRSRATLRSIPTTDHTAALLQITAGPDAGRMWHLATGEYVIGRSTECDIALASDSQCSRRHARLSVGASSVTVTDLGSSNGVLVKGVRVERGQVGFGDPIQLGESVLTLAEPLDTDAVVAGDGSGGRAFSRPPRLRPSIAPGVVTYPARPAERGRVPFPLIAAAAPLAIGIVMAVVMKRPEFLLFTALSPIIAVSNHVSTKRQGKRSYRQRMAEFERARANAEGQLADSVAAEEAAVRVAYPDPPTVGAVASGPQRRLWERRPGEPDFMVLRIGLTDRPASVEVKGRVTEDDDSSEPVAMLRQVPTTFNLPSAGVIGVAGPTEQAQALVRWFVAQLATWQAPDDVSIVVLSGEADPQHWAWARWLPHTRTERERRVADVAFTDAAVARLCAELAGIVDDRLAAREASGPTAVPGRPIVAVVDGVYRLGASSALTKILRYGPGVGVYAICIEAAEQFLPEECKAAAVFDPAQPTRLVTKGTGEREVGDVLADLVAVPWCENIARSLAPLRLTRGQEVSAGVPTSLRLLDELGLEPPDPARIVEGWAAGGRTTRTVIGRTAAGQLEFDISRHGPHGLVAGTTGSGKSELLQTIIASLAVVNRPDAMTFVLVDYKGGSAFKECAKLPHTVGMVTDLDGHLTERALVSLGAELRRREHVLLGTGAKDIEDLVRQCQRTGENPPLARLLLVIDEFASLVEELPGFVDGLVDIARRGRSLGIHLILATQRPAGVVSAPIKANTNFRIAMRVTDAADSVDVIDSNLASRIAKDVPGRAYLRVGHEQLTEFQAARVGGFRLGTADGRAGIEAYGIGLGQLTTELPRPARTESDSDDTDLSVLVAAINEATAAAHVTPAPSPWLDPLPEVSVLDPSVELEQSLELVYGLEDFPEEQRQARAVWDIERTGHLLICGDTGSGRSSALRALAASVARQASPADVHLFGIDCGNGMLGPLAELPHCGAIASRIETDRVDRLLGRLGEEIAARQQGLARGGFASIADQRSGSDPAERWPYLVLLVDRWEGFTATFDSVDNGRLIQEVLHLMREGVGAGLRVVLAGDRSVLSGRIGSLADQTLVLNLNDRATYGSAGLNPRTVPDHLPPGRALRAYGRTELQFAVLDANTSGPAQASAIAKLAATAQNRWRSIDERSLPAPIGILPAHVELTGSLLADPANPTAPYLVGVGGDRVAPCGVTLGRETAGFVVAGPARSGRSNLLLVLAEQALTRGVQVVAVTSRPSPLAQLAGRGGVVGVFDAEDPAADIDAALRVDGDVFVFVDDAELVTAQGVSDLMTDFVRRGRDTANCLVLAGTTAEMATGFRGFVPEVRKARFGVILCAATPTDGEVLGARLPKTSLASGPVGRGILVRPDGLVAVQTPLAAP